MWGLDLIIDSLSIYAEDVLSIVRIMIKTEKNYLKENDSIDGYSIVAIDNLFKVISKIIRKFISEKNLLQKSQKDKILLDLNKMLYECCQIMIIQSKIPTLFETNINFIFALYEFFVIFKEESPDNSFWTYFDFTFLKTFEKINSDVNQGLIMQNNLVYVLVVSILELLENDRLKIDAIIWSDMLGENPGLYQTFIQNCFIFEKNLGVLSLQNQQFSHLRKRVICSLIKEVSRLKLEKLEKIFGQSAIDDFDTFLQRKTVHFFDETLNFSNICIESIIAFNSSISSASESLKKFDEYIKMYFPVFANEIAKNNSSESTTFNISIDNSNSPFWPFFNSRASDRKNLTSIVGHHDQIANSYLQLFLQIFHFGECDLLEGLHRFFLVFNMRGETQMVERILTQFAQTYSINQSQEKLSPDNVFFLCFAIMMLNTDLHTKQVTEKMQVEDFIKNVRYGVSDELLQTKEIEKIYTRIKNREIQNFEYSRFHKNAFSFHFKDWSYFSNFVDFAKKMTFQHFFEDNFKFGFQEKIAKSSIAKIFASKIYSIVSNKYISSILENDETGLKLHEFIIFNANAANSKVELFDLNDRINLLPSISEIKTSLKIMRTFELYFGLSWRMIERHKIFAKQFIRLFFEYFVVLKHYFGDQYLIYLCNKVHLIKSFPKLDQKEVIKKSGFSSFFTDFMTSELVEIDSRDEIESQHAKRFLHSQKTGFLNVRLFKNLIQLKSLSAHSLTVIIEELGFYLDNIATGNFQSINSYLCFVISISENLIKYKLIDLTVIFIDFLSKTLSDWTKLGKNIDDCFHKNIEFLIFQLQIFLTLENFDLNLIEKPKNDDFIQTNGFKSLNTTDFEKDFLRECVFSKLKNSNIKHFQEILSIVLDFKLLSNEYQFDGCRWFLSISIECFKLLISKEDEKNNTCKIIFSKTFQKLSNFVLKSNFEENLFLVLKLIDDLQEDKIGFDPFPVFSMILDRFSEFSLTNSSYDKTSSLLMVLIHNLNIKKRFFLEYINKQEIEKVLQKVGYLLNLEKTNSEQFLVFFDQLLFLIENKLKREFEVETLELSFSFSIKLFSKLGSQILADLQVETKFKILLKLFSAFYSNFSNQINSNGNMLDSFLMLLERFSNESDVCKRFFECLRLEIRDKCPVFWIKVIEAKK